MKVNYLDLYTYTSSKLSLPSTVEAGVDNGTVEEDNGVHATRRMEGDHRTGWRGQESAISWINEKARKKSKR